MAVALTVTFALGAAAGSSTSEGVVRIHGDTFMVRLVV
jgi:hypothetical protein